MVSVMGKRGLFLVWLCLVSILPGMAQTEKLIDYVNPFVGTDGYGNVYPGAQIPFGGIQMSPDTDSKYYDAASGYKYNHSTLLGFSLTHLSGTGIPDLGDFLPIPFHENNVNGIPFPAPHVSPDPVSSLLFRE